MSKSLSRGSIDTMLPEGAAWSVAPGGDFDKLLDGVAEIEDETISEVNALANIRNPEKTTILSDLEKEYGIVTDNSLTETQRRALLKSLAYAPRSTASKTYLQERLHEAGFTDFFVYDNNPAVNPNRFITDSHSAVCGNEESVCGNETAYCSAYTGGEYVANGWGDDILSARDPDDDIPDPPYALIDGDMEDATIPDWAAGGFPSTLGNYESVVTKETVKPHEGNRLLRVSSINEIADGDMEKAGVTDWSNYPGGVASKETNSPHSGYQVIRCTKILQFSAIRTPMANTGDLYISGWARGDGVSGVPRVVTSLGASILWTGTTSTDWQEFGITVYGHDGTYLILDAYGAPSTGYVEFDDICATEINRQNQNPPYAYRSIEVGKRYFLSGWTRSDGYNVSTIKDSGATKHTVQPSASGNGTDWQYFEVEFVAVYGLLVLTQSTDVGWVEWDTLGLWERTNNQNWNLIFFVGGDITRGTDNEIITIESPDVYEAQRLALRRIILKYKPLHTWGALAVTWRENLVIDGDMELAGTTNWTPGFGGGSPTTGDIITKETDNSYDGTQYLRITNNTTYQAGVAQQIFEIGKRYKVTGVARAIGPTAIALAGVGIFSFGIGAEIVEIGIGTDEWTEFEYTTPTIEAPVDSLYLGAYGGGSLGPEGYADFDNIVVIELKD